jgi:hypothetical protein
VRYLIFLAPIYLALLSYGVVVLAVGISHLPLTFLRSIRWRFQNGLLAILVLLLCLQAVLSLPAYYDSPKPMNLDLRAAFN